MFRYSMRCLTLYGNRKSIISSNNCTFRKKYIRNTEIRLLSSVKRQDCSECFSPGGLDVFCNECGEIRKPAPNLNYFELLGVEKTFDVEEILLSKKYKELQKLLHPDKFSRKSDDEKTISDSYSSLVNKAYSTLLDPLARGLYMLELKNIVISENTEMQSDFLMEIMERNEAVAEADTPDKILKINKENKIIISDLIKNLSTAFQKDDDKTILNLVVKLKYFTSIDNQIKEMIRKMGIIR